MTHELPLLLNIAGRAVAAEAPGVLMDRTGPSMVGHPDELGGHVVIVGSGRVGRHIAEVLGRLDVPRLAVETDPAETDRLRSAGVDTHFGDGDLELGWATPVPGSAFEGLTLADANLRARCGVSVVAIAQDGEVSTDPGPDTRLRAGDRVALIGPPARIAAAEEPPQAAG